MVYVVPVLAFFVIGTGVGIILTVAGKVLEVESDATVEAIMEQLPGINCGACGFSGCEGYAKSVAVGEAPPTFCKPGGEKAVNGIGKVLGIEIEVAEKEVAYIHCNGNCNVTTEKYKYIGTQRCDSVIQYYSGVNSCRYGCAGFGDCKVVCEYDAINIIDGIAVIDQAKCVACGLCIKECPNKLISSRKISQAVNVACSSKDKGKATTQACKNGCIACKMCEKKCPYDAIHVVDNIAIIDSEKCTNCGICVDVCPKKCIHKLPVCNE